VPRLSGRDAERLKAPRRAARLRPIDADQRCVPEGEERLMHRCGLPRGGAVRRESGEARGTQLLACIRRRRPELCEELRVVPPSVAPVDERPVGRRDPVELADEVTERGRDGLEADAEVQLGTAAAAMSLVLITDVG